ncbi:lipopolysaccharide biosynthesis protein [Demequina sp. NBRC 110051]|uniref:lipopolysaccharide biosynthesis protein n=1 Tax=Demequina sp. NBRC 110051 TaxID=1570340 RepID=UPI00117ED184|nr:oligosaccharide flippase family protein [Demequina sp. NBRC 110051]
MFTYAGYGLSIISAPMIAQALGAEGRGALAAAVLPVQVLSWIAFLGVPRGLAVAARDTAGLAVRSVLVLSMLGMIAAAGVWWAAPVLVSDMNGQVIGFIRVLGLTLVLTGVSHLGSDLLLAAGRMFPWNAIRAFAIIVPSVLQIVLFLLGRLTLGTAFAVQLTCSVFAVLLGSAFAFGHVKRQGARIPWRFSIAFWGASTVDSVAVRVDQLLLAALLPLEELGVYAVAVTCASAAGAATQALADTSFAKFVERSGGDSRDALRARARAGLVTSAVTSLGMVALVALFGDTLFGEGYEGLLPLVAVLLVYQTLGDQWRFRTYHDSAQGQSRDLLLSSVVGLGVLVALVSVIAVLGHLSGVAVAISMVVMATVRLLARRVLARRSTQHTASTTVERHMREANDQTELSS